MVDVEVHAIQDFDGFKKGTIGLMEQKAAETCLKLGYIEYITKQNEIENITIKTIDTKSHALFHRHAPLLSRRLLFVLLCNVA